MLLAECSRCGLYQVSIQAAMSRRAWCRVAQRRRAMSSCCRVEKNDSAAALSNAQPTRPMDWVTPRRRHAAAKSSEVYWPALVGVEDHPGDVAASGGGGHVDRRGGELGGRVFVGGGVAQHAPRVQVLDCGEEHRSLMPILRRRNLETLWSVAEPACAGAWGGPRRRDPPRSRTSPLAVLDRRRRLRKSTKLILRWRAGRSGPLGGRGSPTRSKVWAGGSRTAVCRADTVTAPHRAPSHPNDTDTSAPIRACEWCWGTPGREGGLRSWLAGLRSV